MSKINFVKQKHKHACSIACVAMLTGENYDDIIKEFINNFHKNGIDDDTVLNYVANKGYSTLEKEITRFSNKDLARAEMLKPFAPIHLVKVKINPDSGLNHWVIMTKKGKFICPMEWSDALIRASYRILLVVGIYKD